MTPTIETERLRLRGWETRDFEAFAALRTDAALQRFVIDLQHHYRDADIGKTHGDTATHGTAADNGDFVDVPDRCVFG